MIYVPPIGFVRWIGSECGFGSFAAATGFSGGSV
jgi:hypothetical protein